MSAFFRTQFLAIACFSVFGSFAQQSLKSILINHGANACGSSTSQQHFMYGTLGNSPTMLSGGSNGIPFYSVFTAYNSKDKKVYFADIATAGTTKVYALDYNLTGAIANPAVSAPTYTYNYTIDQLCFDKDGNNIAIYNYNNSTARARIKQIDLASGNALSGTDQVLNFPLGNQPNSLSWGDMVYMPNGRIFMTFGNTPSKLYELINYDGTGAATAVFLADIPKPCYSIGYVDGNLIVGGSNGSSCYYYIWDINSNSLGAEKAFPLGKTTADITHMNVGVGVSEELIGGVIINTNTADIIYEVVVKNKGNIDLANAQISNNLIRTFGAGNISNVQAIFYSNAAGLTLNPSFNGDTDTLLLLPGQTINNYPVTTDSIIIRIQLRATNLTPHQTYYNTTIATGEVGAGVNYLAVRDSSNNGTAAYMDIDYNGVSDDAGEGFPTPFNYTVLLPLSTIHFAAAINNNQAALSWNTQNETDLNNYTIERSADGIHYTAIAVVAAKNTNTASYQQADNIAGVIASRLFYRLRINDDAGSFKYSNVIVVKLSGTKINLSSYPNPFISTINVQVYADAKNTIQVNLFDGTGRVVRSLNSTVQPGNNFITIDQLSNLPKGMYIIEVNSGSTKVHQKLMK
jgi:hypothetical protein